MGKIAGPTNGNRTGQGPIGWFAPGSELARERKSSVPFCHCRANAVNSLPELLQQPDITFGRFKRSLKTFMFG